MHVVNKSCSAGKNNYIIEWLTNIYNQNKFVLALDVGVISKKVQKIWVHFFWKKYFQHEPGMHMTKNR